MEFGLNATKSLNGLQVVLSLYVVLLNTRLYFSRWLLLSVQCNSWHWTDIKSLECLSVCVCVFYSLVVYGLKWVRFDSRYGLDTRFMDSILRVHKLFRCSIGF